MARGEVERAQQVADRGAREAEEQAEASVVKLTAASNAALALAQSEAAALAARTWTAVVLGFAASLVGALVITAVISINTFAAPLGFLVAGQVLERWGLVPLFTATVAGVSLVAVSYAALVLRHRDEDAAVAPEPVAVEPVAAEPVAP